VSAAALVIASLSAALYGEHERAIAERRFSQLRQLSNKIFDLDEDIRDLPGSTQAGNVWFRLLWNTWMA